MRRLIFLLILVYGCEILNLEKMAVSVPNTDTFSLSDVVLAVEDHAGTLPGNGTLQDCFDYAEPFYFDDNYDNDTYAVINSMKRFRNYGPNNDPINGDYPIMVPDAFSPNNDGINDYFEVFNLQHYPNHKGSIFSPAGGCNCGGNGFYGGQLIYSRTNNYDTQPWDGKYNGVDCQVGYYTFVLEINGKIHTTKTIHLRR